MVNKKTKRAPVDITELELDMLLLYYTFSDQYGRVDIQSAATFAIKTFGYVIKQDPMTISQEHIDVLMDKGVLPDTRQLFNSY